MEENITMKLTKNALDVIEKYGYQDLIEGIESKFRKLQILADDLFFAEFLKEISSGKLEPFEYNDLEKREQVLTDFLASYKIFSLDTAQNEMNKVARETMLKEIQKAMNPEITKALSQ